MTSLWRTYVRARRSRDGNVTSCWRAVCQHGGTVQKDGSCFSEAQWQRRQVSITLQVIQHTLSCYLSLQRGSNLSVHLYECDQLSYPQEGVPMHQLTSV